MWQAATTASAAIRRPETVSHPGDAAVLDQQPRGAVAEHHPAAVGFQPPAQRLGQPAGAADRVAGRDVVHQRGPADHRRGAGFGHRRAGLGAEPGERRLEPLAAEPAVEQRVAGAEEVDRQLGAGRAGPAVGRCAQRPEASGRGRRARAGAEEAATVRLRGAHTSTNRR